MALVWQGESALVVAVLACAAVGVGVACQLTVGVVALAHREAEAARVIHLAVGHLVLVVLVGFLVRGALSGDEQPGQRTAFKNVLPITCPTRYHFLTYWNISFNIHV